MQAEKYTILVLIKAKPGKEAELKKALLSLTADTLKEDGCLNYDLHQSLNNSGEYMIYENWINKEYHARHDISPHILKWRSIRHAFSEEAIHVSTWKQIGDTCSS